MPGSVPAAGEGSLENLSTSAPLAEGWTRSPPGGKRVQSARLRPQGGFGRRPLLLRRFMKACELCVARDVVALRLPPTSVHPGASRTLSLCAPSPARGTRDGSRVPQHAPPRISDAQRSRALLRSEAPYPVSTPTFVHHEAVDLAVKDSLPNSIREKCLEYEPRAGHLPRVNSKTPSQPSFIYPPLGPLPANTELPARGHRGKTSPIRKTSRYTCRPPLPHRRPWKGAVPAGSAPRVRILACPSRRKGSERLVQGPPATASCRNGNY